MNVLVIGAGGYLGSSIVERFLTGNHEVRGLVRNTAAAQHLQHLGAKTISGDLNALESLLPEILEADAVIYAAQLMLEPEKDTVSAILDTLEGTGKTFIFTSGTGVLSQRTDGEWSEDTFAEDDHFIPSKYIGARRDTEDLVRLAADRGIRTMVVRPSMIWGRGGCPMIAGLYQSATATGSVCYIGRGLNLYSNVHVDDVAELFYLAVEKGIAGALYHAVSGETNFRTIADAVARALGAPTRSIDLGEAITFWDKFTALVAFSVCSRSRAVRSRSELGWHPHPDRVDILDDVDHPNYVG
ncbi:NAD-dependent epimerase/dehydratase family protein [Rhodococcus globerulus]|uniref:NAD-dependent epimerase/dehydratase family protein n=1 Tax=Rhodococcus globerulus TaxID=33008 RepID=UPI003018AF7B